MKIESGDAFACSINAHRHQWNGTICSNPVHWNCGSSDEFREESCDRGLSRCHHFQVFDPRTPRFITPDQSLIRAISEHEDLLDDQILFFFGEKYAHASGIIKGSFVLYGAYRIKKANLHRRPSLDLVIEPYPEDWAIFPRNFVRKPATPALEGINYLRRLNSSAAKDAVRQAVQEGVALLGARESQRDPAWSEILQRQLQRFGDHFEGWMETAKEKIESHPISKPISYQFGNPTVDSPFSALKSLKISDSKIDKSKSSKKNLIETMHLNEQNEANDKKKNKTEITHTQNTSSDYFDNSIETMPELEEGNSKNISKSVWHLPEMNQIENLTKQYGERLVKSLRVATASKSLVILTGGPGVGKSLLANSLIYDPKRERSIIVPVSSTWRGREDLLGYVNPITREFEPTEFTRFLLNTENAWNVGERNTRLVVFEEFNLSQPEHWFSDLLVRLEYEPQNSFDRSIDLGGASIAGFPDRRPCVFLPPNLIFVATLNNDHTVRPLSPRVLDRAALLQVVTTGREAIGRIGIPSCPEIEEIVNVVEDLNDILDSRGLAFSVRSARALKDAMEGLECTELMSILDHVVVQGVLSKLRFQAGDPSDEILLKSLQDWISRPICSQLVLCSERISSWEEALRAGRDIFQA